MIHKNFKQDKFTVDLNGFDGPLELLLSLAQKQKVDLKEISITDLVDQYLFFLKNASQLKLELAAEYLMMASFLTYLKSRILLPKDFFEEELSASEMEKNLAFKLKRLSEIKNCTEELFLKPKLGEDFFKRGFYDKNNKQIINKDDTSLLEILRAFAKINSKKIFSPLKLLRESIFKIDEALKSIVNLIYNGKKWVFLQEIIPKDWKGNKLKVRSAMATTFAASLELVKSGDCRLEQSSAFQSLKIKSSGREDKK
ncbi:MAG: segregation and condensation protein A [Paracoccaceae bacterium]